MYYPAGKPNYPEKPAEEKMCGDGFLEILDNAPEPPNLRAIYVKFKNGGHTKWHWHTGEQLLYGIKGKGFVELEGVNRLKLRKGDRVIIPDGVWHRHGARKEKDFIHLAVTAGVTHWNREDPCED